MKIGILALQGAFALHALAVERAGHEPRLVRAPADFDGLGGLVIPGGESTVQERLAVQLGLAAPLADAVGRLPTLVTCAGLIVLARTVDGERRDADFRIVDVTVARNAWGRQVDSFEARSDRGAELVFIRAPRITAVGPGVEVMDTLAGEPVLVRQGSVIGATFHPELTSSLAVHRAAFG
jgi:5'-phosphate synthase pdxT subunit